MTIDRNKLQYLSIDANDKVVYENSITISNSGPSGSNYSTSDKIVSQSIANPYGKKCMVRFKWKLDNDDYNSQDTVLEYSFAIDATAWGGPILPADPGCKGAVSVGISDTEITFRTNNGHHGTVTYTGTAMTPGPDSYTAVPHDFTIEYALYEVD